QKHGTVGTFWAERFRSVIVEADTAAQRMVAAYIDLNPVRAGLVEDVGDYGFSGFGEACAGSSAARRGIARIEGKMTWSTKWHERYRARLCSRMGPGVQPRRGDNRRPSGEAERGDRQGTAVTEGSGLLSKIRAFSEGWVVGSVAWVEGFRAADGWLGLRREKKAKLIVQDGRANFATVAAVMKRH
ncbi:MAG: hypothetical protein JJT96_18950, partial [Opitutales bacterium]|nr:hypothetical protein [Opitutales bacterium]